MRQLFGASVIAFAALLAACSHGGNATTPALNATSDSRGDVLQQKIQREQTRATSSFVAPKHPGFVAETPTMQSVRTGIQEAGAAPVPGGMFSIINQYNTMANGQRVTVYAGSLKATGAGIVLVVRRSANLHDVTSSTYTVARSAVRIQSASGDRVQLQDALRPTSAFAFRVPM